MPIEGAGGWRKPIAIGAAGASMTLVALGCDVEQTDPASFAPDTAQWACDRSPLVIQDVRAMTAPSRSIEIHIADGAVKWIGAPGERPAPADARVIDGRGALALPGLIDSHVHFDALPAAKHLQAGLDAKTEIFPVTMRQTLASGVTTARAHLAALDDMAFMRAIADDDCFAAPRIVISGPGLLGGAPDVDGRLMRGVAGPDDAAAKIAEQAALGAEWAALHGIERFTDNERRAIIDAAANHGVKLMADTDSFESLTAALDWPIVSGEYINRSAAPAYPAEIMAKLGEREAPFYIAPPLGYYVRSYEYAQASDRELSASLFPFVPYDMAKEMRDTFDADFDNDQYIAGAIAAYPTYERKFAQLKNAGAQFVVASDTGSLGQFHSDAVWREMEAWRTFGATHEEIIAGATSTPARMLERHDIGALRPGARGDLILYRGDIAADEFERVKVDAVFKGGVVYVLDGDWTGPNSEQLSRQILAIIDNLPDS